MFNFNKLIYYRVFICYSMVQTSNEDVESYMNTFNPMVYMWDTFTDMSADQEHGSCPFEVGSVSTNTKQIDHAAIRRFAQVSDDENPLHTDRSSAQDGPFGEKIAHGILSLGLVSSTLADYEGTIVFKSISNVKFVNPVYINDEITATSEITDIDGREATVEFTVEKVDDGETVITGDVVIIDATDLDLE